MGRATSFNNYPKVYWHGGGTEGYSSILIFSPELQSVVMIRSNIEPQNFKEVMEPYAKELLFFKD